VEVLDLLLILAAQGAADVVDVGAKVSEGGLYGIISVLGLTTVGGWGLAVRLLLKKGDDVLAAERALHKDYGDVIKDMRSEFREEYKGQHEKNSAAWEKTATAVTELRFVVERLIDRYHQGS
jgi:hypothetical protein